MTFTLYQIDAFADAVFSGNPAAVIPLDNWIPAELMQQIALENNLSETAFIVQTGDKNYEIRWFTPTTEVDLCGHATLASAHALFEHIGTVGNKIEFSSKSGTLKVEKRGEFIWLDFPSQPPRPVSMPKELPEALGVIPIFTGYNTDLIVVVDSERTVQNLNPDFEILKRLQARGVIVTAKGNQEDFVSRFFAPAVGVPEDPVTGSAHTVLIPYWSRKLDKKKLTARQISRRSGRLLCEDHGDRVLIGGRAVTYLEGTINV